MLGQLELLDSKGKTKPTSCVEGPSAGHHVVDQRLPTLRILLLQVLLELHIIFVGRDLVLMDLRNPIFILHQMEHLLNSCTFRTGVDLLLVGIEQPFISILTWE